MIARSLVAVFFSVAFLLCPLPSLSGTDPVFSNMFNILNKVACNISALSLAETRRIQVQSSWYCDKHLSTQSRSVHGGLSPLHYLEQPNYELQLFSISELHGSYFLNKH